MRLWPSVVVRSTTHRGAWKDETQWHRLLLEESAGGVAVNHVTECAHDWTGRHDESGRRHAGSRLQSVIGSSRPHIEDLGYATQKRNSNGIPLAPFTDQDLPGPARGPSRLPPGPSIHLLKRPPGLLTTGTAWVDHPGERDRIWSGRLTSVLVQTRVPGDSYDAHLLAIVTAEKLELGDGGPNDTALPCPAQKEVIAHLALHATINKGSSTGDE